MSLFDTRGFCNEALVDPLLVKDCHFQLTAYMKECVESYLSIKILSEIDKEDKNNRNS